MSARIVIVGGGPAGLGAAYQLHEQGYENFRLYERNTYAGGLAASFEDARGFVWDIGGHVQFSTYEPFNQLTATLLGPDLLRHDRRSAIYIDGRLVPFPLQRNLRHLPDDQLHACLDGLVAARAREWPEPPVTYREWLIRKFGHQLTALFFEPYARKVWVYPTELMSCRWVPDRVADVDLASIRASIERREDDNAWGPNATFTYPRLGGAGELWRRLAARLRPHIELEMTCSHIDMHTRRVQFQNGTSVPYDRLISTMPLDQLMQRLGWPAGMRLAQRLVRNSVSVYGIGIKGRIPPWLAGYMWIYFPAADVPLYRATLLSKLSPQNVPSEEYWSLLIESADMNGQAGSRHGLDRILTALTDLGILGPEAPVVGTWTYRTEYGYPVPSLDRDAILRQLLADLEAHDIYSRGRFGLWRYEVSNQDHTFMQGVEVVNHILHGAPERVAKEGLCA